MVSLQNYIDVIVDSWHFENIANTVTNAIAAGSNRGEKEVHRAVEKSLYKAISMIAKDIY